MVYTLSRRKQVRNIYYIYNKRICTTVNSHINSNKSNNLNTPNSDNVIGNSNLPHINVQNNSPFNILITLQKEIDTESTVSINDEIMEKI